MDLANLQDRMWQHGNVVRDLIATNGTGPQPIYYGGLDGVNLGVDRKVTTGLASSILLIVALVLGLRTWQLADSHLRHLYCLNGSRAQQKYWSVDHSRWWPWIKREVIYAPLGTKRHNRELQLSKAHNYGTIPGRIQTLLLTLYLIGNIVFCLLLDFKEERLAMLAELRGRTGVLAVTNLVPLVVMAGRNNPLIGLLKISFDTFNLFHRWIGRLVVAESVIHVLAWFAAYRESKGASAASRSFINDPFLCWGLAGSVCMGAMAIQSLSAVRHAFYETFLQAHQMLAVVALLAVYVHLDIPKLPALPSIRMAICLWLAERLLRVARIVYLNHARQAGSTKLVVTALPGEASRLTFQLPRHVTIQPGSHVYVYLPKVTLWQSHPFSVAWTYDSSELASGAAELGPKTPSTAERQGPPLLHRSGSRTPTTFSLICAARTGMTRKIYEIARASPSGSVQMCGFVEGPYAGHESLASYGTVFLYAGGAGITHHLVQIRHLLASAQDKTVATRKIVLVWTVREAEAFSWVRDWMEEILTMPGRREMLRVYLYVTRPKKLEGFVSAGKTMRMIAGRCCPGAVLDQELPHRIGATMVSVCGPGAFADEVRAAVRARIHLGTLDMNEESFTW
ncbi:hypothetical protein DV737_g3096, partial [Chaetothyriales sp. CBS 132003]